MRSAFAAAVTRSQFASAPLECALSRHSRSSGRAGLLSAAGAAVSSEACARQKKPALTAHKNREAIGVCRPRGVSSVGATSPSARLSDDVSDREIVDVPGTNCLVWSLLNMP
jgi:hypothetical protein